MREGTISILYGAHSIIHSYYVWKAWKILYKKYPSIKETICIIVHDLGYFGMNYYSEKSNAGHAELGANIAEFLFGEEYKNLILGHSGSSCKKFNLKRSKLERPDEYSWLIAPLWWIKWTAKIEKYITPAEEFIEMVRRDFFKPEEEWQSGTDRSNKYRENIRNLNDNS